jgi:predicted lipoprotein with Yx(FWY)xxD motif
MLRSVLALAAAAVLGLSLAPAGHAAGGAALKTRHNKLGTFLVDGKGRTLYLFQKDKPRKSSCSGACASDWPPALTSGKPSASGGARKSLLGTIKRGSGKRQLTYNGHPLYRYVGDSAPGDTNGQGVSAFGARWYAVASSGRRLGGGY